MIFTHAYICKIIILYKTEEFYHDESTANVRDSSRLYDLYDLYKVSFVSVFFLAMRYTAGI